MKGGGASKESRQLKQELEFLCRNTSINGGSNYPPNIMIFRGGKYWKFDNKPEKDKPFGNLVEGQVPARLSFPGIHFPGGTGHQKPDKFIIVYKDRWSRWKPEGNEGTGDEPEGDEKPGETEEPGDEGGAPGQDKMNIKNKPKDKGKGKPGKEGPKDKVKIKNKPNEKEGDGSGDGPEEEIEDPTGGKKGPKDQMKIKNKPNEKEGDGTGDEGKEPDDSEIGSKNRKRPKKGEQPKDGPKDKMKIKNKPNDKEGEGSGEEPEEVPDGEKVKIKHKPNEKDGTKPGDKDKQKIKHKPSKKAKEDSDVNDDPIRDEDDILDGLEGRDEDAGALIPIDEAIGKFAKIVEDKVCYISIKTDRALWSGDCVPVTEDENNFPPYIVAAIRNQDNDWFYINRDGQYCQRKQNNFDTVSIVILANVPIVRTWYFSIVEFNDFSNFIKALISTSLPINDHRAI